MTFLAVQPLAEDLVLRYNVRQKLKPVTFLSVKGHWILMESNID